MTLYIIEQWRHGSWREYDRTADEDAAVGIAMAREQDGFRMRVTYEGWQVWPEVPDAA